MQAEIREKLEKSGIDVSVALERFMKNELLFERFLIKFLSDSNYEKLEKAIDTGDKEAALIASHTLKGICGNLSMSELFDLLSRQVAAFRAEKWDEGIELMKKISEEYKTVVEVIRSLELK